MVSRGVIAALGASLLLAGCGSGDTGSAGGAAKGGSDSPRAAGGLPPPAPTETGAAETRFMLSYPQAPVPSYTVGQDVEVVSGGKWVAAKVMEVADVDGEHVVRTTWPEGTSMLPYLISNKKNDIRPATGRLGQDLLIGRYICADGGTDRSDLNFRVAAYGQYTDPYGENPGTFTTSGTTITFSGGKLDGSVAQQVENNSAAYFTPQFVCRWQAEGLGYDR